MEVLLWALSSLVRWVRLKIYQYEVTFAIYMLTPTEKFIFSRLSLVLLYMGARERYSWGTSVLTAVFYHTRLPAPQSRHHDRHRHLRLPP